MTGDFTPESSNSALNPNGMDGGILLRKPVDPKSFRIKYGGTSTNNNNAPIGNGIALQN